MAQPLDLSNMTLHDIDNLDINDPQLQQQFGIQPLPEFDETRIENLQEERTRYKNLLIRAELMQMVIDYQRETLFGNLKTLHPSTQLKSNPPNWWIGKRHIFLMVPQSY